MIRSWAFLGLGTACGVAGLWMLLRLSVGLVSVGLVLVSFMLLLRVPGRTGGSSPPPRPEPEEFESDAAEWRKLGRTLVDWKVYAEILGFVATGLIVGLVFQWQGLWDTVRRYLPWIAGVLPPQGEEAGVAILSACVCWMLVWVRITARLVTGDSRADRAL